MKQLPAPWLAIAILILSAVNTGCTHTAIEDCGGKVLGVNEPRIRSSHFRMLLNHPDAAAQRFASFAMMSALTYVEDKSCDMKEPKVAEEQRLLFTQALANTGWKDFSSASG